VETLADARRKSARRLHGDQLVKALLRAALAKKPNVKAIAEAFNRAYGKAKQVVELTGANGGPVRIDLKRLTKEDLDALEAIVDRAAAAAE
jgi:phosphoheptose isomerase